MKKKTLKKPKSERYRKLRRKLWKAHNERNRTRGAR